MIRLDKVYKDSFNVSFKVLPLLTKTPEEFRSERLIPKNKRKWPSIILETSMRPEYGWAIRSLLQGENYETIAELYQDFAYYYSIATIKEAQEYLRIGLAYSAKKRIEDTVNKPLVFENDKDFQALRLYWSDIDKHFELIQAYFEKKNNGIQDNFNNEFLKNEKLRYPKELNKYFKVKGYFNTKETIASALEYFAIGSRFKLVDKGYPSTFFLKDKFDNGITLNVIEKDFYVARKKFWTENQAIGKTMKSFLNGHTYIFCDVKFNSNYVWSDENLDLEYYEYEYFLKGLNNLNIDNNTTTNQMNITAQNYATETAKLDLNVLSKDQQNFHALIKPHIVRFDKDISQDRNKEAQAKLTAYYNFISVKLQGNSSSQDDEKVKLFQFRKRKQLQLALAANANK